MPRAFVDRWAAAGRRPTRWVTIDAALYTGAAAFAIHSYMFSRSVDYRTWAACAWPAYGVAALAATLLRMRGSRLGARRLMAARAAIGAVVLIGAVALPLAREVDWRASRGSQYAASEVLVTEAAADEFLRGRNPYAAHFGSPDLAWRTPSIADHFPYLPGMALAGVPHALAPQHPWTDARLFFALITVVAAGLALSRWRAPPDRRVTTLQFLILLPTGAPMLVTGGDDIPVLALSLLALVLLHEGRLGLSMTAAAAAALLKLTAWPVLLAIIAVTHKPGEPPRALLTRSLPAAAALVVAVLGAAPAPASFANDVVLFPLGLTASRSPADSHTLGRVLLSPVGDLAPASPARVLVTGLLLAGTAAACGYLPLHLAQGACPAEAGASAALAAAGVLLVLILLAPIGRSGYLIYPIDLAVWGAMLSGRSIARRYGARAGGVALSRHERYRRATT